MHAATDSIKSLQVCFKIHALQYLSMRLERNEFENNLKIDVVPPHGSIYVILSTTAMGYLNDIKKLII